MEKAVTMQGYRQARRKRRPSRHRTTSEILSDIVTSEAQSVDMRGLTAKLGERSFGLALLLFALPNSLPLPIPGISTLTSLPLIFFSAQLCFGHKTLWLPAWLARRTISMSSMRPVVQKALPWLRRLEKVVKPRLDTLTTRRFERLAGGIILLLAVLLALPIPLSNLPLGIAITTLALAITERDGRAMITGWIFAILALCFFVALLSGYTWILWRVLSSAVGI